MSTPYEILIAPIRNEHGERRWIARAYVDDEHIWSSEGAPTIRTALREVGDQIRKHHDRMEAES